jgi:UDP-N-acetylglucosamine 2-epimerase
MATPESRKQAKEKLRRKNRERKRVFVTGQNLMSLSCKFTSSKYRIRE